MDSRLIALAIPVFFLLIAVEAVVSRVQKVRRYRLHDTLASLGCGIGEQVIVAFTATLAFVGYLFLEKHAALLHIGTGSVVAWVLVFVVVDHQFYWFHRASHRVNFMWAGHAVHHQSEDYNLSTALRQSWIENLLAWPFYLPMAIVGFPFAMFATASTVNTLYQFWVHTRLIGKLGPAEGVLNTPSSHRVHHGVDPKYVDKNYGGMFMVWDRLYGTYTAEEEEPIYGTVKPLQSWSPLWAQIDGWVRLWTMARATSRFGDKVRVWVAPPDWRPADLGGQVIIPEVDRGAYRKYDSEASSAIDRYVVSQFLFVAAGTSAIMWFSRAMSAPLLAVSSGWVLVAVVGWGGLFEGRRWAVPLEVARHAAGLGIAFTLQRLGTPPPIVGAMVVATVVSLLFLATSAAARPVPSAQSRSTL